MSSRAQPDLFNGPVCLSVEQAELTQLLSRKRKRGVGQDNDDQGQRASGSGPLSSAPAGIGKP